MAKEEKEVFLSYKSGTSTVCWCAPVKQQQQPQPASY